MGMGRRGRVVIINVSKEVGKRRVKMDEVVIEMEGCV